MSEADLDARVRDMQVAVGGLKQQVHDHENDIRAFGPLVTEQALIRQLTEREFAALGKSIDGAHNAIRVLGERLEAESRARIEGQRKRKEELEAAVEERKLELERLERDRQRQHQEMKGKIVQATFALVGVFATSLGAIVVTYMTQRGGG